MVKSLFLGLKHGRQSILGLENSGANHFIAALDPLTKEIWQRLKKLGATLAISLTSFDGGGCPADPRAFFLLKERIKKALDFQPQQIWLDHFRFDGHWERIKGRRIPGIHKDCFWCRGKDRVRILVNLARKVKELIGKQAEIGYFAVPFREGEVGELISGLGQDHRELGKIFGLVSPMLYHRMINRPVSYISEYADWIFQKTEKPVLPIIQVKDMPDNLPDKLSGEEVQQAFNEACKPSSIGVSFFSWDHAVEKGKTELIRKLFGDRG